MFTFIGDAGIDEYTVSNEKFLGGCALNVATHFSRNSKVKAKLIYPAANDAPEITDFCKHEQIHAIPLYRNGKTPTQFIQVQKNGEKKFTKYHSGVLDGFKLDQDELQMIGELQGYIVCPLYSQILPFIDQIIEANANVKFIFDFHDAQDFDIEKYLKFADLAQFGLGQNHKLEAYLIDFAANSETSILITRGAGEVTLHKGCEIYRYSPTPIDQVVDSTGAGDAFLGAYLALNDLEEASIYAKSILSIRGAGINGDFK